MAAPKNPVGPKSDKIWRDAVMRAVKRMKSGNVHALEQLADKTVEMGLAGDMAAIKEIGDRLDGRPAQDLAIKADATNEFLTALRMIDSMRTKENANLIEGKRNNITNGTITIDGSAEMDAGVGEVGERSADLCN